MANLRLKRLKIEKLRNVVPGTELVFADGMNVLLGRNGTGKTTLLQLIARVTRSAFEALAEEDFAIEYDVVLLGVGFRVALASSLSNGSEQKPLRSRKSPDAPRADWSFSVSMLFTDGTTKLILSSSPLGMKSPMQKELSLEPLRVRDPLREAGPIQQAVDVLVEAAGNVTDTTSDNITTSQARVLLDFGERATQFQDQLQQHGGRFDEGLGTFHAVVGDAGYLSVNDAEQALVFYNRDSQTADGFFVPGQVTAEVAQRFDASALSDLTLGSGELPFLRRALRLIGAVEAKMILGLQKGSSTEDGGFVMYGDFEFLITMDDGSIFRHDLLSYGQKRLLSFLYYAAANPEIIIADELVNGLHHEWIEACLEEIKDRQCFLTSQNPLLLDYLSFDSAESVQGTFLLCDRQKDGRRAQLVWRHMDRDAADGFFRAYRAGVQHVSEILRTRGLW